MGAVAYEGTGDRRKPVSRQTAAFRFANKYFITPLTNLLGKVFGGLAGKEKGSLSECRFLDAWNDLGEYEPWIVQVRKGTRFEDTSEKTDAVLITHRQTTWRIQIKSSEISAELFLQLTRYGVVPLFVPIWETPEKVRRRTMNAIADYQSLREAMGLPPETNP